MINHETQWKQIQSAWMNQRIPQAMLFVGPLHCDIEHFALKVIQLFLCQQHINEPCKNCIDCQMVQRMEHPDMDWVRPDKSGGAIKIDQIRELQNTAYITPQRSKYKLIVIEAADRMNTASANALLKILEEPAKHTLFVLIAQQLSTVLPTILSRCHIKNFSAAEDSYRNNLLLIGEHYSQESERALIIKQAEFILDGLIALLEKREHPCHLASQWSQFELGTMLWFLYLVFSQLQNMHFNTSVSSGPAIQQLIQLKSLLSPVLIFMQIDKINTTLGKISHNMNVNHALVVEDLLFSLV